MKIRLLLPLALVSQLLNPVPTHAAWVNNGAPVSAAVNNQTLPVAVSDGAGGAIVAWIDSRVGVEDIYVQRLNPLGNPVWTNDGVALCSAVNSQYGPVICSDGAGGAIVAWYDYRSGTNYDIYAQRINSAGVVQWTANGVAICTAPFEQSNPTIAADGAGGAIMAWNDYRSGATYDTYAQRVNAAGAVQWTANGVAMCTAAFDQAAPTIVSDGAGGAIVTWQDSRVGGVFDIYAQRANASGVVQWTANGVPLCVAAGDQGGATIVADASGGAIVTWFDYRGGANTDIYAQRVNAAGVTQWAANGAVVCNATNSQYNPVIASDGAGGGIVTWYDFRAGNHDIYTQRITSAGVVLWSTGGVPLCTAAGNQLSPVTVADGSGGAIAVWQDIRGGVAYDIYAQRIAASGEIQWTYDGVDLCTSVNNQNAPTIVSDGAGGAIVAWYDFRSGVAYDVYAQRVEGTYGYWGHPEPIVASVADVPHDQGGHVAINWTASGRDQPVPRTITYYTIWRAVDSIPANITANSSPPLTDLNDVREGAEGPVYTSTAPTSTTPGYYWELVGTQSAHGYPGYSFSASTRADSISGDTAAEVFMVAAHIQYDDYVSFPSNAVTGHSVDNLAPTAPLMLIAQRVGADVHLKWNGVHVPDFKNYAIYRATSAGVTPIPANFIASDTDTLLVDASAPASALHYIVTALDVHLNQSPASNEANVSPSTGVGNLPSITALTVRQNHPNPFAGSTDLEVGLPAKADVKVEVFDVTGRRVRETVVTGRLAGWSTVHLDARDDKGRNLPSGVYFYKVHAGNETVTKKMVIAR